MSALLTSNQESRAYQRVRLIKPYLSDILSSKRHFHKWRWIPYIQIMQRCRVFWLQFMWIQFLRGHSRNWKNPCFAPKEIGCFMGALSNLWIGDKLGRRRTIILGGLVMIVGAILQTTSINYSMMLVARVITGLGNGLNVSTIIQVFHVLKKMDCARPLQYHHITQNAPQPLNEVLWSWLKDASSPSVSWPRESRIAMVHEFINWLDVTVTDM